MSINVLQEKLHFFYAHNVLTNDQAKTIVRRGLEVVLKYFSGYWWRTPWIDSQSYTARHQMAEWGTF